MNFEIVELEEFSGKMATVYSVMIDGDDLSLFDNFLIENKSSYLPEINQILSRLYEIGHSTGAREHFFKVNEGKPGDGVCALYDVPESNLRLYCIRYGKVAIILGGGGPKPNDIKTWQDDEKLTWEASTMIRISKEISTRLQSKEIEWSPDGTQLTGNLIFSDDE